MTTISRPMTNIHDCALNDTNQDDVAPGLMPRHTIFLVFFASHRLSNCSYSKRLANRTGSNNSNASLRKVDNTNNNHRVAETWLYQGCNCQGRHWHVDKIFGFSRPLEAHRGAKGRRLAWKWRRDGTRINRIKEAGHRRKNHLAGQDTMQRPLATVLESLLSHS
ncbi:hypothetical protein BDP67DRAFT_586738 [Colletotrichum lupini]|nr:hypothetical protein BDP67DRAFT_586738 [Colletotrichum lupini]